MFQNTTNPSPEAVPASAISMESNEEFLEKKEEPPKPVRVESPKNDVMHCPVYVPAPDAYMRPGSQRRYESRGIRC